MDRLPEADIAAAAGATVRMLLTARRERLRLIFARYLGGVTLVHWGLTPLLAHYKWPVTWGPVIGFAGGLAAVEILQLVIKLIPDMIQKRLGPVEETPDDKPHPEPADGGGRSDLVDLS